LSVSAPGRPCVAPKPVTEVTVISQRFRASYPKNADSRIGNEIGPGVEVRRELGADRCSPPIASKDCQSERSSSVKLGRRDDPAIGRVLGRTRRSAVAQRTALTFRPPSLSESARHSRVEELRLIRHAKKAAASDAQDQPIARTSRTNSSPSPAFWRGFRENRRGAHVGNVGNVGNVGTW
jgi:hypothetical protein